MSIQLGNKKRSVTRHITSLKELLKKIKEAKAEQRDEPADGVDEVYLSTKSTLLSENICALKTSADRLDESLSELCTFADEMDDQSEDLIASIDKYITDSHDLLATARDHLTLLQARLQGVKEERSWRNKVSPTHDPQLGDGLAPVHDTTLNTSAEVKPRLVELPTIPIPKFSGEIWEWENFWALFKSNVHDLEITDLQKYNYLLHALKGDAKDAVARFQICAANYPKAIALLTAKYAKTDSLVRNLLARLDSSRATSHNIKDQRRLLDQLSVIISQLDSHNEVNNGTWVLTKTLAKFSEAIQRKVLNKRVALPATTAWDVTLMMNTIEEVITAEETVQELMAPMRDNDSDTHKKFDKNGKKGKDHDDYRSNGFTKYSDSDDRVASKKGKNGKTPKCLYCGDAHYSWQCTVMVSIAQRTRFLTENGKCLVCTSQLHTTADCTRLPCRECGKRHHSSLCPARQSSMASAKPVDQKRETHQKMNTPYQKKTGQQKATTAFVSEEPDHVLQTTTDQHQTTRSNDSPAVGRSKVLLLTGQAQVMDPATQQLKMVDVLLDTGSELSFVDSKLAQELQLASAGSVSLNIHTFGSTKTTRKRSEVKSLRIWDRNGTPHDLRVHTNDVLTSSLPRATLGTQDVQFIKQKDIHLSMDCTVTRIHPRVLIGSDQLWTLMNTTSGLFTLPSGLILVPTLLGYMLTGKECKTVTSTGTQSTATHTVALHDEKFHFDRLWRMEGDDSDDESFHTHACMVTHDDTIEDTLTDQVTELELDDPVEMAAVTELSEEMETFDAYWRLDAVGTQDFGGTETAEKERVNQEVLKEFTRTIEKREDGYYVRYPWKENAHELPDNRSIAMSRLRAVYNQLKKLDMLQRYHDVFIDQLDKGIIEIVNEHTPNDGHIHYIPHQPVVTPQKETTKLRVVFDASAHYKGSPSLNDVVHQGPLILPELQALLVRFRLGSTAIISDVEKAFLQVRLHEDERNASRCFWLKDCNLPPTTDNIQVFRFTRVTFGINASPFLLAATIDHHLTHGEPQDPLVHEIRKNLYVDNLLLTSESTKDSIQKYRRSKEIFQAMNMNLREFVSNDPALNSSITDTDRAKQDKQKVLGITWDTTSDALQLQCCIPDTDQITKRVTARQLATIYDPLGWLLPLTHDMKTFHQSLWKHSFDWDTELPTELASEWRLITARMHGFKKDIPRMITSRNSTCTLVTFADASGDSMAACTYLCSPDGSHLVMARSKLPSLQESSRMTIPKMEMCALTLGTRMTTYVLQAVENTVKVHGVFFFSDSQPVLGWLRNHTGSEQHGVMIKRRLKEIEALSTNIVNKGIPVKFGYINTKKNPADSATRGLNMAEFGRHYWWHGTDFIRSPENTWPTENTCFQLQPQQGEELTEVALVSDTKLEAPSALFDCSRYHTLMEVKHVVAYCLRFIRSTVDRVNRRKPGTITLTYPEILPFDHPPNLSREEECLAEIVLVRSHQMERVTEQIVESVKSLNLRPDRHNILRCNGRMDCSQLTDFASRPIFVLQKTPLADLIIRDAHGHYHKGHAHTMAEVRQRYWIPQLRAQVIKLARRCLECQRFNALPYTYPDQGNLPSHRVRRSRTFEHTGLDNFGPLCIRIPDKDSDNSDEDNESSGKAYGLILTCMVTRLIHLELVSDMTTVAFIHALRRFFARRGVPSTITCDNAPTFLLGEDILDGIHELAQNNDEVEQFMSEQSIKWHHSTPYAPWQAGFYERLIKSVKHAMYKTMGKTPQTFEELTTTLAEIEATLNTRPLTYQGEHLDHSTLLRPIDFIQRDMIVSYPIEALEKQDDEYYPPATVAQLRTRKDAEEALRSSHSFTEVFWKIWVKQYLTALREHHQNKVGTRQGCARLPVEGQVVLLYDENQPRHAWRRGRIGELITSRDGKVREAHVIMPSRRTDVPAARRTIRRPVNLLIPLELDDSDEPSAEQPPVTVHQNEDMKGEAIKPHYNLRERRRVNYNDETHAMSITRYFTGGSSTLVTLTLMCLMLCTTAVSGTATTMAHDITEHNRTITCTDSGVRLVSTGILSSQVCADNYCMSQTPPLPEHTITFPAEVTLHTHKVTWKFSDGKDITTIETTCPPAPFCESIDCTFCSAVIFNPECWPITSFLVTAMIIYFLATGCYVFLYVPLVVGRPVRLIATCYWHAVTMLTRGTITCLRFFATRRRRRGNVAGDIMAITFTFVIVSLLLTKATACQDVDIAAHKETICTSNGDGENCKIEVTEIMKINPFKQEACVRLSNNGTVLHEIRISWKTMMLYCNKATEVFTRDVKHTVVDSKRCPRTGSCVADKCGDVNRTSIIPELSEGNTYPGNTYCQESCGGPGCDCFFLGSGCLFHRIYMVPTTQDIYEVFRCTRWTEEILLDITHHNDEGNTNYTILRLQPNIPVRWQSLTFTLSSITLPPIPLLNTPFITTGDTTATWMDNEHLPLRCTSSEHAANMSCEVDEQCHCHSAEVRIVCDCRDTNITKWFSNMDHRLPVINPALSFTHNPVSGVTAHVDNMATSEILMHIKDDVDTSTLVEDGTCSISDAQLTGCYNCIKGAITNVTCKSSLLRTRAEVSCGSSNFAVPCTRQGMDTTLHFALQRARTEITCTVRCGSTPTSFTVSGILRYTAPAAATLIQALKGETSAISEIAWPDFSHILDVYMQWYKTVVIVIVGLLLLIGLTYLTISLCGANILCFVVKQFFRVFRAMFHACMYGGQCFKFCGSRVLYQRRRSSYRGAHEKIM